MVEQRVTNLETNLTEFRTAYDVFRLNADKQFKEFQSQVDQALAQIVTADQTLKNEIENQVRQRDGHMQEVVKLVGDLNDKNVAYVQNLSQDLTQTKGDVLAKVSQLEAIVSNLTQSVADLARNMGTAPPGITGSSTGPQKILMEYRIWDDLKKLSNDRSVFRDWKSKFKSMYKQLSRVKGWQHIMMKILNEMKK